MYIFVRTTAIILMILGILAMLIGIGIGLNALNQNLARSPQPQPLPALPDTDLLANLIHLFSGAVVFFQGLAITALGQLMLVFVDIARNTADTNQLLYILLERGSLE